MTIVGMVFLRELILFLVAIILLDSGSVPSVALVAAAIFRNQYRLMLLFFYLIPLYSSLLCFLFMTCPSPFSAYTLFCLKSSAATSSSIFISFSVHSTSGENVCRLSLRCSMYVMPLSMVNTLGKEPAKRNAHEAMLS